MKLRDAKAKPFVHLRTRLVCQYAVAITVITVVMAGFFYAY